MPTKLSLKEALARQASSKAGDRGSSGFPAHRILLEATDLSRPVELAKTLVRYGLSLKRAHGAIDRLASGERVAVEVKVDDVEQMISGLTSFGLNCSVARIGAVDVKQIRERQQLSQTEFSLLYGLDERTLQNWEQHRNEPDAPARILLKLIETHPELVVDAVYDQMKTGGDPA
ncbi:helix-turn-helix domain-containing protein [Bradyrhizobium sp. HKCCYLS3077]|uniref:helix-turn-helix domain-containing protein n=1 Tax=unclassified Bradyrhizobium TaxID=2631580 RepID=UPI003EC0FFC0